ncbi:kinase-like domain-containing protein [Tuber brumale]|nr:kinase-like domain-containing protein [Tuber brumale]
METEQSELVEWYRLETEFLPDHVRHTKRSENSRPRREGVKEEWINCEVLGVGDFSVVHKQLESSTGHCRAVKVVDKTRLPAQLEYSRALLVMAILAKHPLLFVKFLGWFEGCGTLYIAMEHLEVGDLRKHISEQLPQDTVRGITKQLLEGLAIMHGKGIAHRDIKPEKIFVVSMSPVWVKLGDFGISKRIQPQDITTYHTWFFTGSYTAPEVLGLDSTGKTSGCTNAIDIWSLGCVIYELLTGEMLFSTASQMSRYFFGICPFPKDKFKGLSPATTDAGISLIKSMVSLRPNDRPSVQVSLGHTWITDLKSEANDEDSGDDIEKVAQIPAGKGIGVEMEKGFSIKTMKTKQSDLVEWYRLETEFLPNHVRHTKHSGNSRSRRKEEWSDCEVLGEGSFSIVHKQLESSTGNCRAVKVINKTRLPAQLDYSRELLTMVVSAKVHILSPRRL